MDVPDASDYWLDMAELLQQEGVAAGDILSVSAVSGQGVPELVRRVRARLEELPKEVSAVTGRDCFKDVDVFWASPSLCLSLCSACVTGLKGCADQADL